MALPMTDNFTVDGSGATIAAICTAMEEAGIGIIRVSGEKAIPYMHEIFRNPRGEKTLSTYKANTIHYGTIEDPETGRVIDEVLVSVMKAPHSYTAEDTVEINGHGGVFLLNEILKLVLKQGCRLAEPGEFTKRAFLNGRLDLSRAEAVMDLIASKSETARKLSLAQLSGDLSGKVKKLREKLIYELAYIESALDDPENYSLDGYPDHLSKELAEIMAELRRMLQNAENGRILKEGIKTCILGKPNAGKSSLLNALAGSERAIVTDVAGTTRDTLEESIRLGSVSLRLIDTAGIRETEDKIEQIGVERARKAAAESDLLLVVFDASAEMTREDREVMDLAREMEASGKKVLFLLNKADLFDKDAAVDTETYETALGKDVLVISAREGMGLDALKERVETMFMAGDIREEAEIFMTNARHMECAEEALAALNMVQQAIEDGTGEDFYSIDMMTAYSELGKILGEQVEDDLVEEIFSKFCMGK